MELSKEQEEWFSKTRFDEINAKKAPKKPLTTEEFCLAMVQAAGGYALQFLPDKLKTEEIYLAAVKDFGTTLEFVPDAMKTEVLCLAAVQKDGRALKFVPDALKTEALCLAAVQQDGRALEFVPDALKTEALCLAAVQKKRECTGISAQ